MSRSLVSAVVCVAACTKAAPPPNEPVSQPVAISPTPAAAVTPATPTTPCGGVVKNQPPQLKLKLGHYKSARTGIGAVIDQYTARTDNVADIDPVKLRFDGDDKVYTLTGTNSSSGSIDYWSGKKLILHAYTDGHFGVFVPDPETDKASDEISLVRDGDADPL